MPISTETTHFRKAGRPIDGCQLPKCWIRPHDRRQSRSENTIEAKNVRPRGIFSPAQLKRSIDSKKSLTKYLTFLGFAHILWEATKTTIVLTDDKSVTRFSQTKAIPPALWNACNYVLQFNFKIAHIAESVNTAADFLSRLQLKVREMIRLKVREDNQTTPLEVTTSSPNVADEEQFFFTQVNNIDESEEQTLERKKQSR